MNKIPVAERMAKPLPSTTGILFSFLHLNLEDRSLEEVILHSFNSALLE
jgi:hypothetical protein